MLLDASSRQTWSHSVLSSRITWTSCISCSNKVSMLFRLVSWLVNWLAEWHTMVSLIDLYIKRLLDCVWLINALLCICFVNSLTDWLTDWLSTAKTTLSLAHGGGFFLCWKHNGLIIRFFFCWESNFCDAFQSSKRLKLLCGIRWASSQIENTTLSENCWHYLFISWLFPLLFWTLCF